MMDKCFAKHLVSKTFLTHILTHTEKPPYKASGSKSTKEDAEEERKGLKMTFHRHLKGLATLRNQQVAHSEPRH